MNVGKSPWRMRNDSLKIVILNKQQNWSWPSLKQIECGLWNNISLHLWLSPTQLQPSSYGWKPQHQNGRYKSSPLPLPSYGKFTVFLDPFPSFPIYVASNIGSLATFRGHQSHGQMGIPVPLLQIQILSHKVDVGYARIGVVDHMNCWSCLPWAVESTKMMQFLRNNHEYVVFFGVDMTFLLSNFQD